MVWEKLAANIVLKSIEDGVTVKSAMKDEDENFQASIIGTMNSIKNA